MGSSRLLLKFVTDLRCCMSLSTLESGFASGVAGALGLPAERVRVVSLAKPQGRRREGWVTFDLYHPIATPTEHRVLVLQLLTHVRDMVHGGGPLAQGQIVSQIDHRQGLMEFSDSSFLPVQLQPPPCLHEPVLPPPMRLVRARPPAPPRVSLVETLSKRLDSTEELAESVAPVITPVTRPATMSPPLPHTSQHADHEDNFTFDRVENITFRLSKPSWRKDDHVAGPSISAESLSRLDIQKLQSNILRALPTGEHHVVVVKDSDAEEVSVRLELPLPESAEESVEGEPHVRNAAVGVSRSTRESALKKTVNALRSHAFLKELDRLHAIDQQTDRSDVMAGVGTTVGKRSSNVPEGGDEFFFTTLPEIGAGNGAQSISLLLPPDLMPQQAAPITSQLQVHPPIVTTPWHLS
ncbi:MAG: hypothetical protein SGPRY_014292, partial [Prymnesium sp.]